MSVLVFGHRNPDTDAICSALAYADLLRRTSRPDAVAACCGPPNERTEFALARAGVAAPRLVMDVRPQVEDVCRRDLVTASFGDTFHEAYERMRKGDLRAIPVVDADRRVVGVLSILTMMELFFTDAADSTKARAVATSLEKIREVLGGTFRNAVDPGRADEVLVMVGSMSAEGFTERMRRYPLERLVVVCGDRPSIQLPAIDAGVRALVITGGFPLAAEVVEIAKAKRVSIISSPFDTVNTTLRIKSAQFIDPVVERDVVALPGKWSVAEARGVVERSAQPVFPVVGDDGRLAGLAFRTDIVSPPRPQLVLVDHNELAQAVHGADEAEIVEVLDHHRLGGGLKSTQPIRFVMEPVGSTCTLVARQFRAAGLEPAPGIALCMASGIISDTLHLRSPTTTDVDREVLAWLGGLCGGNLEAYAKEFFELGSALRSKGPADVIREDCKEFTEHGVRFSISQIEETGFDLFWEKKEELRSALEAFAERQRLEFAALLVTDVVSNGSLLLLSKESEAFEGINYPRLDRSLYALENVVSRKKQLLPLISQLLS
ncbi:MAG: putative manganese-dependent inorganic diphosphatase [Planctomycetia bacterium]|nr:putative manganese-dependent inorganic diphosphatase [Planctomycetia bacterium]